MMNKHELTMNKITLINEHNPKNEQSIIHGVKNCSLLVHDTYVLTNRTL